MLNLESVNDLRTVMNFAGVDFNVSRLHAGFGIVVEGIVESNSPGLSVGANAGNANELQSDYLHQHFLMPENRSAFFDLVAREGLVVCKNVDSNHPGYRKVRGKSSNLKLSQAEYYHHDGCSCPQNPRLVEIRLPYQEFDRNVATAVAPFPAVMRAMQLALPAGLQRNRELIEFRARFEDSPFWNFDRREFLNDSAQRDGDWISQWDRMQGQMIRIVRKEMDAASCRVYYREVDQLSGAYVLPWTMGESRLMLNFDPRPEITMQHRRAYQKQRDENERNGHLEKRWTAEEI